MWGQCLGCHWAAVVAVVAAALVFLLLLFQHINLSPQPKPSSQDRLKHFGRTGKHSLSRRKIENVAPKTKHTQKKVCIPGTYDTT